MVLHQIPFFSVSIYALDETPFAIMIIASFEASIPLYDSVCLRQDASHTTQSLLIGLTEMRADVALCIVAVNKDVPSIAS